MTASLRRRNAPDKCQYAPKWIQQKTPTLFERWGFMTTLIYRWAVILLNLVRIRGLEYILQTPVIIQVFIKNYFLYHQICQQNKKCPNPLWLCLLLICWPSAMLYQNNPHEKSGLSHFTFRSSRDLVKGFYFLTCPSCDLSKCSETFDLQTAHRLDTGLAMGVTRRQLTCTLSRHRTSFATAKQS